VKYEFKHEIFFQNEEYTPKDPKAEILALPRLAEDLKIERTDKASRLYGL